jgi:hypothetical protein
LNKLSRQQKEIIEERERQSALSRLKEKRLHLEVQPSTTQKKCKGGQK